MLLVDVPRRFDMHTSPYCALVYLAINLTTHKKADVKLETKNKNVTKL